MRSASAFRFSKGCSSLNLDRMLKVLVTGDGVVVDSSVVCSWWSAGDRQVIDGEMFGREVMMTDAEEEVCRKDSSGNEGSFAKADEVLR